MFTNVKGFLLNVHLNLFKLYFEIIVGLHSVLRHEREILYALCLVFFNGTSCKSVTQYHNQKIGIGVIRSTQFPPRFYLCVLLSAVLSHVSLFTHHRSQDTEQPLEVRSRHWLCVTCVFLLAPLCRRLLPPADSSSAFHHCNFLILRLIQFVAFYCSVAFCCVGVLQFCLTTYPLKGIWLITHSWLLKHKASMNI